MKDKTIKENKAPLDNLILYPFLKRKATAERVLSMIFGEKLKVEEVRHIALDKAVGKVVSFVLVAMRGEKGNYLASIRRLDESLGKEKTLVVSNSMGKVAFKASEEKKYSSYLPCTVIFDQTETEECEFLVQYHDLDAGRGKKLRCFLIDPDTQDSGPVFDVVRALATGERGIVPWIDECMDQVLSKQGKEEDKEYWDQVDERWKISLGGEMLDLGVGIEKIMDTLDSDAETTGKMLYQYLMNR